MIHQHLTIWLTMLMLTWLPDRSYLQKFGRYIDSVEQQADRMEVE